MQILSIKYHNIRNLKDEILTFDPSINVFYGNNGQGKTSILESLYFGATGLSFRTRHTQEMISYEKDNSYCMLEYQDKYSRRKIMVELGKKKKQFFFLSKKISQSEFYGLLNVIFYIPEDVMLINGNPLIRRLFLDQSISQIDFQYLESLKKFTQLLKIKNQYLKERKTETVEYKVYEEEFLKYGAYIIFRRKKYLENISKVLSSMYCKLFDKEKHLELCYKTSISFSKTILLEEVREVLQKELAKKKTKEKEYGFSLVGPQKDDFSFLLNQEEAKFFASQGEKKSIIFSLKLSEIDMIYEQKKEMPVLFIDDITSYFDITRRNSVLRFLQNKNVQVFLSSTELLEMEAKHFYVNLGEIYENSASYSGTDCAERVEK